MKKFGAILLWLALFVTPALAGVPCTLPFSLVNGTTADASQVMANYNALVTCLTNAAHAGANSDITSLTALTTPISPTEGGTTVFIGANSTGTNTVVVASTTPSTFTLTQGFAVVFTVGVTNTGPTTLSVNGTTATMLGKQTSTGLVALGGNELVAGQTAFVVYDGTNYELLTTPLLVQAGSTLLGNPNAGSALTSQITLGTGLAFSGTTLKVNPPGFYFVPSVQNFTSGSAATYTTPTNGGNLPLYLRVRMVAGGGGGGAQSTNAGSAGAATLFSNWTVNPGSGGSAGAGSGGAGGSGGTNGTGNLILRFGGAQGQGGGNPSNTGFPGGAGGSSVWGGAGAGSPNAAGGAAVVNTGSGGAGGGATTNPVGAGGGAGEFVEFTIPAPAASYLYTVGTAGTGGAAGGNAGGNGANGAIVVEAFWQ